MSTAVTVFQMLLALLFTSGGVLKLVLPYAKFIKMPAQSWANDFKPEHVRLIGVLEVCAALGMYASLLLNAPPLLTTLVAIGMASVMAGAMATHLRRSEYVNMIGNLVWLGFALVVAYGAFVGFAV